MFGLENKNSHPKIKMSLKLFKISWPDADWDCYNAKLIVSESEDLALEKCGEFTTLAPCVEGPFREELEIKCIGIPDARYKEGDVVMTDFNRG